jgi:hypothetical protein
MSWIEKIRNQPEEKRIRMIWIICSIIAGLFIILWFFTSKIGKFAPVDKTPIKSLDQGIEDFKNNY